MAERILIVKIAALGDAVMASTLLPAIRRQWPEATIGWVAGQGIAPLVRVLEGVDHVIEVDDRALLSGHKAQAVRALAGAWFHIGRGWNYSLVAHTDRRYAALSRFSGANITRRFAGEHAPRAGAWHGAEYVGLLNANPALANPALANPALANPALANPNQTDRGSIDNAPPFATVRRERLPQAVTIAGNGPLIVVAPGGARNLLRDDPLRRWPLDAWTSAVRALVSKGYRVAAVGGAGDTHEGAACERAGATNFTGRMSLLELMAIINAADVVVTHDAGPLHLALLFSRHSVALFGPTVPAERVPAGASVTVLSSADGLPCAPCYNGFSYAPCALNLCLTRVSSAQVVLAVEERVALAKRPTTD